MILLGLDPGSSSGAVCRLELAEASTLYDRMPSAVASFVECSKATERDLWDFIRLDADFALIEKVHSMPKQGVSSSFKFGDSRGLLRGLVIGAGIPWEWVSPQAWQKALDCRSGGDKRVTKARAQALFPGLKLTHATSDALLIAEYARRLLVGRSAVA